MKKYSLNLKAFFSPKDKNYEKKIKKNKYQLKIDYFMSALSHQCL